ncbi:MULTISPECIES: hypothetical protein [Fructobacillus]|uniref:hypothetical protein n=1 Tax=Fructobacillus TaxID=559173 RepID=UPI00064DA9B3|nr:MULTISPECIES: hypothetical protein [Fructobacillus]KMK52606.1 hypothetical protein FEFB_16760 [Fructobacillus sp. EFB-N1]MCK8628121.1 hypothetical protein [Fructobacillus cardui]
MTKKLNFLSTYQDINEAKLSEINGGFWGYLAPFGIYMAQQAFEHSDQISHGWKSAGKKTFF